MLLLLFLLLLCIWFLPKRSTTVKFRFMLAFKSIGFESKLQMQSDWLINQWSQSDWLTNQWSLKIKVTAHLFSTNLCLIKLSWWSLPIPFMSWTYNCQISMSPRTVLVLSLHTSHLQLFALFCSADFAHSASYCCVKHLSVFIVLYFVLPPAFNASRQML